MIQEYKTDDETSAVPVKIEALAKQFMTHYCTLDLTMPSQKMFYKERIATMSRLQ